MHRLGLLVVLVGCSKSEPPSAVPPKADVPSYADVKGVVVTAGDVRFDGKSIGVLGERLATDRSVLVGQIREALLTGEAPKSTLVLSYTEDAPASVVLAAMRAIAEAAQRPPAEDKPEDTGTAMALDEGKMGKQDPQLARQEAIEQARTNGILGSDRLARPTYRVVALGKRDAKPQVVCEPRASVAGPDESEMVKLAVTFGASEWHADMTRVNESMDIASLDKLATQLKDFKASTFFTDRVDLELVAKPGTLGANVTPVLAAACAVGFTALQPITADELTKQQTRVEVAPPPPPSAISIGQPNVQGDLDKAIMRRYVKREGRKLEACYTQALAKTPALKGTVNAQFAIGEDGKVTVSQADGVDPAVATCVAGVIKAIEFPKAKAITQVNYPFTFHPLP